MSDITDGAALPADRIGSEVRAFGELTPGMVLVQVHDYYTGRPMVRVVNAPAANGRTGRSIGQLVLERLDTGHLIEYARDLAMPRFWHRVLDV